MRRPPLFKAQKMVLTLVAEKYPQVYLVGGTAISLQYHHRVSEDLDFFTQHYTPKLHQEMAAYLRRHTGSVCLLVDQETRRDHVNMAVYELVIARDSVLKIDVVSDMIPLLKPRGEDGIASVDDIYYRKIFAVIGWKAIKSSTGRVLAGGRQKTKDLFDLWYLSRYIEPLSEWFPRHFDSHAYGRLVAWYLAIPKQKTIGELLELAPRCDTKAVFRELDQHIIHQLNKVYLNI